MNRRDCRPVPLLEADVDWNTAIFFEIATAEDVAHRIAGGADVQARDEDRRTPLYWAANSGSSEAVTVLLDAGADPNSCDAKGNAPLHRAALRGSPEAVTALLGAGADPNKRDARGQHAPAPGCAFRFSRGGLGLACRRG